MPVWSAAVFYWASSTTPLSVFPSSVSWSNQVSGCLGYGANGSTNMQLCVGSFPVNLSLHRVDGAFGLYVKRIEEEAPSVLFLWIRREVGYICCYC